MRFSTEQSIKPINPRLTECLILRKVNLYLSHFTQKRSARGLGNEDAESRNLFIHICYDMHNDVENSGDTA